VLRFVVEVSGETSDFFHSRDSESDVRFLKTVRAGFSSPRKKAVSNLSAGMNVPKETVARLFAELGLREDERPERIPLETWRSLSKKLA
jgi:16S rRNA A1518/A1519 N6-dimethyltransferase RsmA/KsgA/DIM1 with predicted DNA glycosylase/AP lyase activity